MRIGVRAVHSLSSYSQAREKVNAGRTRVRSSSLASSRAVSRVYLKLFQPR